MSKSKNKLKQKLYQAILKLEDTKDVEKFFIDLMTPRELEAFADRWEVAQKLFEGMPQRKVSQLTGASIATVTRVNRFLRRGAGGYLKMIDKTHSHLSQ